MSALSERGAGPAIDNPALHFLQWPGQGCRGCLHPPPVDEQAGRGIIAHVEKPKHIGELQTETGDNMNELKVPVFADRIALIDGANGHVMISGAD